MDKEAVEHMHETMQRAGRVYNRVNCPYMNMEMRCTRPMEVQRNTSAEARNSSASENDEGPLMVLTKAAR